MRRPHVRTGETNQGKPVTRRRIEAKAHRRSNNITAAATT
jgi:hypothetical protein